MAAKEKDKSIIKLNKSSFHFNIGMLVFIIILFYTLYFAVKYFTTEHIMAYEVTEGSIAQNTTFTGIALRDETIYFANSEGTINYYVNEGSRVGKHSLVYSLDHSDVLSSFIETYKGDIAQMDNSTLKSFDNYFNEYTNSYNDASFYTVYSMEHNTNERLLENKNKNALEYITASGDATANLELNYASRPGIVVFSTDGYENVTTDSINTYMFREANYVSNPIVNGSSISNGNVAYKLITSEDWHLIVPIDASMAELLENEGAVEIQFLKDNAISYATVSIAYKEDGIYADLAFSNSMVRYCTDRFLDIKIMINTTTGLKIPNSAIAYKDFFLVPKEYLTQGGDSSQKGFMKEVVNEDGSQSLVFVNCDIYSQTDDYYYVNDENLAIGDSLRKPDSAERFILSKTESLQGVYNINKGYALFKQIDILYQNEEYAIVATNTEYGLSQFDFIAIEATDLHEGEIVE